MTHTYIAPPELRDIILRVDQLYPGDVEKQMEWMLAVLRHCLKNNLLDASTLATLKADAANWPDLQTVIEGASL